MAAVAMVPNPVQTLREAAMCPICLDYFKDPVSISCGHSFCRGCVIHLWGEEDEEDRDELVQEEEEEMQEDGEEEVEAVGAGWGWDTPIRDEDYEDDLEEVDEEEGGVFWTGGMGVSNWNNMDNVWEEEDKEGDLDDYLGDVEEEELDPVMTIPPPPAPRRRVTCPQCQKSCSRQSFRPNLPLANMVEAIRQMHPTPGRGSLGKEQGICPRHQEVLKLFCEVDEEAICVVCRESRSHKQHSVVPLEKLVQEYKAKLQGCLEPLRKHLEAVQKMKAKEERWVTELKGPCTIPFASSQSQMKSQRSAVASECGRLTWFLAQEQARLELNLREKHEAQLRCAEAAVSHLEEQAAQLSLLLTEVQERSQQGGLWLLQDIKETFNRCEKVQLQLPEVWSPDPCPSASHDFLTDAIVRKMSRMFCQATRVDLTLDPDTAHPALMLSPDRREVCLAETQQEVADHLKRFSNDCCVLAAQGFSSGQHYWEVEVDGQQGWAVGAACESTHQEKVGYGGSSVDIWETSSSSHHHYHCRQPYLPQQPLLQQPLLQWEVWCVGTSGTCYQTQSSMEKTLLSPREKPQHVGVYLDYEAGRLDLYNLETLAQVHTFSAAFLGQRVFPFFQVLSKGTCIKLCP